MPFSNNAYEGLICGSRLNKKGIPFVRTLFDGGLWYACKKIKYLDSVKCSFHIFGNENKCTKKQCFIPLTVIRGDLC